MKKKDEGGIIVETQKVHKIGGSLMIRIPPRFARANMIKAGDMVPVLADHILKLVPMAEQ